MFERKPPLGQSAAGPVPSPSSSTPPPIPARPTPVAASETTAPAPEAEERKLIIGRGIVLTAEIATCDQLVVKGTVEAQLPAAERIEISEGGIFRGKASAKDAEVGGTFNGELTVAGRLTIRSAGRIEGTIRYGELAVEAGGRIDGELHIIRPDTKPAEK